MMGDLVVFETKQRYRIFGELSLGYPEREICQRRNKQGRI